MDPPDFFTFVNGFRQFLDSGEFSDITIVCGNRNFAVHKVVVFAQSKVLRASCSSGFKESKTNTIDLTHDEPHLVERMIEYFYSGTYTEVKILDKGATTLSLLTLQIEMYSLADKYNVTGLGKRAIDHFKRILADAWDMEMDQCILCVRTIYESTPDSNRGLRDVIINHIFGRFYDNICPLSNSKREEGQKLLKAEFFENSQFGWDFVVHYRDMFNYAMAS